MYNVAVFWLAVQKTCRYIWVWFTLEMQVQEWFKNRRKKDKLLKERTQPKKRGRPSNSGAASAAGRKAKSAETLKQSLITQSPQQTVVEIDTRSLLSQIPQQAIVTETSQLSTLTPTIPTIPTITTSSSDRPPNTQHSPMDTVAGHDLQVVSNIELTI